MHFILTCQLLDVALCLLLFSGMLSQHVFDTINCSECLIKFVLKWVNLLLIVGMKILLLNISKHMCDSGVYQVVSYCPGQALAAQAPKIDGGWLHGGGA